MDYSEFILLFSLYLVNLDEPCSKLIYFDL